MTVTPASIKQRFPEFESLDNSYIQLFIDSALLNANCDYFQNGKDHAASYLTAHLLKISQSNGSASFVTKEKVGQLERSYSSPPSMKSELSSTAYGQEYLRFLRTYASSPFIV